MSSNSIEIPKQFQICIKTSSLEHLRRYWTKTLLVIHRLQKQWEFSFKKEPILQHNLYLVKIRNLLSCYELLIVQFNEYCQVLEIQGLGKCMLKIFIQIISIVETILKSRFQMGMKRDRNNRNENEEVNGLKQRIQKSRDKNENNYKLNNNSYYAQKEKKKFEARQIEQELNKVEQKYQQDIHFLDDPKIVQARKKVVSLQPSNAQFIIREAFLLIQAKQNSLIDLMEFRNQRILQDEPKDFKKSTQLINEQIEKAKAQGSNIAVEKLMKVVEKYFNAKDQQRKSKLISIETQTPERQPVPSLSQKLEREKLKKLIDLKQMQLKKLKDDLEQQKYKNQAIQKVLKQRSEGYQKEMMKQRMAMMKLQQRISITSKLDRNSQQLTLDFVNSELTLSKEQSHKDLSLSRSVIQVEKQKEMPRLSKKKSASRQYSRGRPSYDEIKQSFANRSVKTIEFPEKKARDAKLTLHSNAYQIVILSIPNPMPKAIKVSKNEVLNIVYCDAFTQTQKIKQPPKERQKVVKFKADLKIKEQYSYYLGCFVKNDPVYVKQTQITFNLPSDSPNLLRKKRSVINWPKQKSFRTLKVISEEDQQQGNFNQSRRCFSNLDHSISFQDLSIGRNSKNCFGIGKRRSKEENQFLFQAKMQSPDFVNLNFGQQDIDILFLKTEKAANFQFLNYNMKPQKSKYESLEFLKSQIYGKSQDQTNKNTKRRPRSCHLSAQKSVHQKSTQILQPIIHALTRHLTMVKHGNAQKYEKIRNFMRYPHSATLKFSEQKWKSLSREQKQIGVGQLRKIFFRFIRIHEECRKKPGLGLCEHLEIFLGKIGLSFVKVGQKQ